MRSSFFFLLIVSALFLSPSFAANSSCGSTSGASGSVDSSNSGSASAGSSASSDNSGSSATVDGSASGAPANSSSDGSTTPRKSTPGLNPPKSPSALQGNVQGGAPVVLQGLHDVGVSVHHLEENLKGLLYESQRQDMVVVAEPNVIGPMVIPAIPNPSGMLSMGYLPPRKKWIDYYMAQIEEIIPMLDHEINSLPRPDGSDSDLQQAYVDMFDAARGFNPPWASLEAVTKGPQYKNAQVMEATSQLWVQVKKFNELKNKLFKRVKEEAKKKKNA